MRPDPATYPAYFNNYLKLVSGNDIVKIIEEQSPKSIKFYHSLTEEQSTYRYADGKWSIKEILQHVMDAERIFTYRALAIARGEKNTLPSFDEVQYAKMGEADKRSWKSLVDEFAALRASTTAFVKSIAEKDYDRIGQVSEYKIGVLPMLFVIVGHEMHHINIIRERYFDVVVEQG
ncbi:MAG: DinB family protein [Chitinophagaceae bacterium]|nr:DinB family protein [Chitinophagaceae bacterium]